MSNFWRLLTSAPTAGGPLRPWPNCFLSPPITLFSTRNSNLHVAPRSDSLNVLLILRCNPILLDSFSFFCKPWFRLHLVFFHMTPHRTAIKLGNNKKYEVKEFSLSGCSTESRVWNTERCKYVIHATLDNLQFSFPFVWDRFVCTIVMIKANFHLNLFALLIIALTVTNSPIYPASRLV